MNINDYLKTEVNGEVLLVLIIPHLRNSVDSFFFSF